MVHSTSSSLRTIRRQIVCSLTVLSLVFGSMIWFPQASLAEPSEQKPTEQQLREFTKALVENVRTRKHVLNLLDHADASTEALAVIGADLEKRLPDGMDLPKATLVNDEVVIDGKPSGLKIVSYAPFKIKYAGRFWAANSRLTLDANYLELIRYFEEGSRPAKNSGNALLTLLLPEVQAFVGAGAMMGGMFGAMAGVMLTMGASPASGMMGMMTGFAVGGVIGSLIDREKEREERAERRRRRLERRGITN
jgi:hypothetical protein